MVKLIVFISLCACVLGSAIRRKNADLMYKTHFEKDGVPMLDGRIVGGQATTIEKHPYQVSMRYNGEHFCGGAIFASNIVLTAAHCTSGTDINKISVVAGTSSLKVGGIEIFLKEIIPHPQYAKGFDYDVAITILKKHFEYSKTIQPIRLIAANKILPTGTKSYVSGWGVLNENGLETDDLQHVFVTIIGNKKCAEAYKGQNITDRMVCAGEEFGGRDACQGDSGGPLTVQNILVGLVSWGRGCARPDYPGVYTSIAAVRKWIEKTVKTSQ